VNREEGFDEAFDELFARASQIARRVVHNEAASEDIAAEALIRALVAWPRIRSLPHRDGWVLRTAANLAIDSVRKRPDQVTQHSEPDPAESVAMRLLVVNAVAKLPRRQRDVVALRFLADMSVDEVASSLKITSGAVKSHLHRGLAKLRTLEQFGEVSHVLSQL
jgi:RNA polymerase sigma-70 factor (ECF subfamily)